MKETAKGEGETAKGGEETAIESAIAGESAKGEGARFVNPLDSY